MGKSRLNKYLFDGGDRKSSRGIVAYAKTFEIAFFVQVVDSFHGDFVRNSAVWCVKVPHFEGPKVLSWDADMPGGFGYTHLTFNACKDFIK